MLIVCKKQCVFSVLLCALLLIGCVGCADSTPKPSPSSSVTTAGSTVPSTAAQMTTTMRQTTASESLTATEEIAPIAEAPTTTAKSSTTTITATEEIAPITEAPTTTTAKSSTTTTIRTTEPSPTSTRSDGQAGTKACTLIVNGKTISKEHYAAYNYDYGYVELPFLAIFEALDIAVEKVDGETFRIPLSDGTYVLNTAEQSFVQEGRTGNYIGSVAPGATHGVDCKMVNGEFIIDSHTASLVLVSKLRMKSMIHDSQTETVTMVFFDYAETETTEAK